uniref:RRM domain-containing protein n=1 Tax=Timema monikensis TaxID=170555 RepID=A0A7R9HM51_9NEOP|nr:unnamed protein product [Timema monikensis]
MHNIKTLAGMHHPIQMKPADSENRNERKLFIGMLSKKCTENDVRSMFSPYGTIEECTVLRDTSGQSKGCAFVTYTSKQCAISAIKNMHHSQTMEGCSSPLVVKFADTQKEKDQKRLQQMQANLWNLAGVNMNPQYLTLLQQIQASSGGTPATMNGGQSTLGSVQQQLLMQQSGLQNLAQLQGSGLGNTGPDISPANLQGLATLANLSAANHPVNPMSIQNLVTLAAMTGGNGANLQVSPNDALDSTRVCDCAVSSVGGTWGNRRGHTLSGLTNSTAVCASERAQLVSYLRLCVHMRGSGVKQRTYDMPEMCAVRLYSEHSSGRHSFLSGKVNQVLFCFSTFSFPFLPRCQTSVLLGKTGNTGSLAGAAGGGNSLSPVTSMALGSLTGAPLNSIASINGLTHNGTSLDALTSAYSGLQQYASFPSFGGGGPTASSGPSSSSTGSGPAGKQIEGPEGANLFIYHLPQEFSDGDLASTFIPFGNVISAKVFIDKQTNLSKCFGFVSYDNPLSSQAAIQAMNGFQIGTKRLKVQLKRSKEASRPY